MPIIPPYIYTAFALHKLNNEQCVVKIEVEWKELCFSISGFIWKVPFSKYITAGLSLNINFFGSLHSQLSACFLQHQNFLGTLNALASVIDAVKAYELTHTNSLFSQP